VPEENRQDLTVIGQPLVKVDAAAKVTGQTVFADDLVLPRMAFARLLRSPHPHARIRSIDVSRAAAHPGVLATLVGSELPIPFGILPVSQDEHALCLDKVRFVGDPVAAVAALDEETAEAALALIDVDYEVLPAVMSIDEALAREDMRIHDYGPHGNVHKEVSFDFGQVEDGFAEADHVREDTFFFEGNSGTSDAPAAYLLALNGLCMSKTKWRVPSDLGGMSAKNIYLDINPGSPSDLTLDVTFPSSQIPVDLSWKSVRYRRL